MKDRRGFLLTVGGAFVASSGFLILQFVRSSQSEESENPWLMPIAMAILFVPIVLLVALISGVVAGWARRAKHLQAEGTWAVIAPIMKSETMINELNRVNPRGRGRTIPRGLTLTANFDGIGIWSGRAIPIMEVWLPWPNIDEIKPTITRDRLESFRGVEIVARWGEDLVRLPLPVTGSSPFGTRIATPKAIEALVSDLEGARSGSSRAADR